MTLKRNDFSLRVEALDDVPRKDLTNGKPTRCLAGFGIKKDNLNIAINCHVAREFDLS